MLSLLNFRIIGTLAIILAIIGFTTFISSKMSNYNKLVTELENENKKLNDQLENQNNEIKLKDEFIEEKTKTTIRKSINRNISANDNIEWLRKNRCKDCKSK